MTEAEFQLLSAIKEGFDRVVEAIIETSVSEHRIIEAINNIDCGSQSGGDWYNDG